MRNNSQNLYLKAPPIRATSVQECTSLLVVLNAGMLTQRFNQNATAFVEGNEVYVGANYAGATFKGVVRAVYEDSLLLYNIGPSTSSVPAAGSTLKAWNGTADTGAEAVSGVYRYATEDVPPVPLDNQKEKFDLYDDIIAAKRITDEFARAVIRRYNWDLVANPKFDMWKPDYSATPGGGGQVGKTAATGATTIGEAKFYVINSQYEVFKCLYNGETPANPSGQNATDEPKTTPSAGQGSYAGDIFTEEPGNAGYIWKYMYTIPTNDVLRFLSTDFMPIVAASDATRQATEAAAVDGGINVALIENAGANLPNGTHYAPILGDGTGGKVQITVTAQAISSVTVTDAGSGYTYASVALKTGTGSGATAYGLFSDAGLTASVTVGAAAVGAVGVPVKSGSSNLAIVLLTTKSNLPLLSSQVTVISVSVPPSTIPPTMSSISSCVLPVSSLGTKLDPSHFRT